MKAIFLTSSPTGPLDGSRQVEGLDPMNSFRENLRNYYKEGSRHLMITAFPDNIPASEEMTSYMAEAMKKSGFSLTAFDLLDYRNCGMSKEELQSYDMIWLGGGHVPTQNRFFEQIGLREKLQGYHGIILGISAGTMNASDWVYAEPEEEGEAVDPCYQRYLRGLGLTGRMFLPHYQMVRGKWLDGMRLFEDIVYPDSMGNEFINLTDGSYLLIDAEGETIYGEAWMVKDGKEYQICADREKIHL